jgi:hypothetical protein
MYLSQITRAQHRFSRNGSALAGRDQGQPQAGGTPPVSFGLKGGRPRPGKCSGNIRFAQWWYGAGLLAMVLVCSGVSPVRPAANANRWAFVELFLWFS